MGYKSTLELICQDCEYFKGNGCGFDRCIERAKKYKERLQSGKCKAHRWPMSMIPIRAKRFLKERKQWVKAGRPLRSFETIRFLYDEKCRPCEEFDNDQCLVCECRIKRNTRVMNKLAWATTRCPLDEPKWVEEVKPPEIKEEDLAEEEIDNKAAKVDKSKVDSEAKKVDKSNVGARPEKRGCCG